jgi:ribosomal protein S18 acetylase RimI-like enzyme
MTYNSLKKTAMNITLTLAKESDFTLIYQLAESIWNIHYVPIIGQEQVDYMLGKMYAKESLLEQMQEKKHIFYIIEKNGQAVGFISISDGKEAFLNKFYVLQSEQGKGIGKIVFDKIIELYPHIKIFRLTVNRKNYKSINFYFKMGFYIESVEDFDIGNNYYMNDFVMKWEGRK